MANIRFLWNNLLASATIVASSIAAALITGAQKNGAGSGGCIPGGSYTGTTERTYLIVIDGAGNLGAATFKWSDDGGSTWTSTGVLTSGSPIALSNGVTVYFTSGSGTNFSLSDSWTFKALLPYGPAKLTDGSRNTECRTAGVTGAKTWTADLGSAQAIQALEIRDHNLTSGATITLAGNTADSWGAPAFGPVTITWAAAKILYYLASTQTYRYWQLSITDAGNPDGYLRMSNVFLGPQTDLSSNFNRGWRRGPSPILDGDLAGLHPEAVVLAVPEILEVDFQILPVADRDTLVSTIFPALYSPSVRKVKTMVVHPNPSVANDGIYGYWEPGQLPRSPYLDRWDLPLRFRELVRAVL